MSNVQAQPMTKTVGYYNGAKWNVQLCISKLNITLHLRPGEYLLDRSGRKINDPYFEHYPQLSKEVSDKPVPLVLVPDMSKPAAAASSAPSVSVNPVTATSKFVLDSQGIRRPAMPSVSPQSVLSQQSTPEGADPVRPMSMEEARRLGLVRRVREVPEDYGVNDTTGLPPRVPPSIKYAIDPSMLKKPAPLPQELSKVSGKEVTNASGRVQLIHQLSQNAATPAVQESASAFLNETIVDAPPNSPVITGSPMPHSVLRPPAQPIEESSEMSGEEVERAETGQAQADALELPPPDLAELQKEPAPVLEEEIKPAAKRDRFICPACGQPFKFRSQLDKHAQGRHKAAYEAIMRALPPEE